MNAVFELPRVSFFLNWWLVALGSLACVCVVLALEAFLRQRYRQAVLYVGASFLVGAVFAANSVLASPSSWQAMYAAFRASPPSEASARAHDIAKHWSRVHDGILVRDWYLLSRGWGVCHELWRQTGCVPAPLQREPMGVARALLSEVANGV
jgi:hypothetical protein